jgi:hypothetical protein
MTLYIPCSASPFTVASAADRTGLNTGNLTTVFDVAQFGTMPPVWEWFRCTIAAAAPGQLFIPAPCSILRNLKQLVSFTYPVGGTEWDPVQPIPLRDGDELYFLWGLASSVTPVPVVTLYARYDADVPANRNFAQ